MASIFTTLGLRPDPFNPTTAIPNLAPYHIIFNFLFAYVFLSARLVKMVYKIDHNISPREDLTKYGDKYVQDGKITRRQLELMKRNEACHANSMEHFPVLVAAVLFATVAGVRSEVINAVGLGYGVARGVYAAAYLGGGRSLSVSYVRSLGWWASNLVCLWLLWESGRALNAAVGKV